MSESLATAAAVPVVYGEKSYPLPSMKDYALFQASMPGLSAKERASIGVYELLDWLESFQGIECLRTWYSTNHKVAMPDNVMDCKVLLKEVNDRFLVLNRLPLPEQRQVQAPVTVDVVGQTGANEPQ